MSDLIINVRQVGNYPAAATASPSDLLLLQRGGLGGSYMSIEAQALVATALEQAGPLGVGVTPPTGAAAASIYTGDLVLPVAGEVAFNATAAFTYQVAGFQWSVNTAPLMALSNAGALSLSAGTLTVARDPASGLEVATMGWVGRTTVASFNGRRGAVTLTVPDIYQALCLDSPIATEQWVQNAITAGLQSLLTTCPFVNRWNGRTGSVYLMLSDISCVFMQPGQKPITQTPPANSDDYSIANTAWVTNYVQNEFAGAGSLATQAWVLANTVNSFNNRQGAVTLNTTDITNAGGAPANNANLTGVPNAPTANPGTSTAQIATTAYVMAAVQSAVTGVISFNTRTGAIELTDTDIYDAGGALLASPAFTGTPTAPTAPPATATTQLATTAFVMNEIAATTAGVASFNTRVGAVTLLLSDVTGVGGAPLDSPAFTGTPTVPTPVSPVAATLTIANTNWVVQYCTLNTVASFNGRTGAVVLTANDITAAGALANPSPALTGTPTSPTAVPGTSTTQIATTAFVQNAIANFGGGISVSPTPPASPVQGQGWYNLTDGQTYIWTGTTWAIAVNPPVPNTADFAQLSGATFTGPVSLPAGSTVAGYLPLSGGTLTGAMVLSGNAAAALNPVPLQQLNSSLAGYLPLTGGTLNNNANSTTLAIGPNDFTLIGASGLPVLNWASGWYDLFRASSSTREIWSPGGVLMTISTSVAGFNGNLSVGGQGITYSVLAGHTVGFGWNGNLIAFIDGNNVGAVQFQSSDATLKENLAAVTVDCLSIVTQLVLQQFDWIPTTLQPSRPHVTCGFTAQNVQTLIPEAVPQASSPLSVDLMSLLAYCIGAIQQLAARVQALDGKAA